MYSYISNETARRYLRIRNCDKIHSSIAIQCRCENGFDCFIFVTCLCFIDLAPRVAMPHTDLQSTHPVGQHEYFYGDILLSSEDFRSALLCLLSTSPDHDPSASVGPSTLKVFEELLFRLKLYCPEPESCFAPFAASLLTAVTSEEGPLSRGYGPLDLQGKLIVATCSESLCEVPEQLLVQLVYSVARLAVHFIMSLREVRCDVRSADQQAIHQTTVCFSSVFSGYPLLSAEDPDRSYGALSSRSRLISSLLQLLHNVLRNTSSTSNVAAGTSDLGADEEKQAAATGTDSRLADLMLTDRQPVRHLLTCLAACTSAQLSAASSAGLPLAEMAAEMMASLQARSVGDWALMCLTRLHQLCSNKAAFLDCVLQFIDEPQVELREPLLLFLVFIVHGDNLQHFLRCGGLDTVCRRFVDKCVHVVSPGASHVTGVMLQMASLHGTPRKDLLLSSCVPDSDDPDALVNFAPYGSIMCSSSAGSHGTDALIHPRPPHQRAKAPVWSYNFYPEESYTELTIRLPAVVLLSAVDIGPHALSLACAPSAVSFELRREGSVASPLCGPLDTSGLTNIRLRFPATLANELLLRLHRGRDADSVGLSHIQVKGNSLFAPGTRPQSSGGAGGGGGLNWLRLVHHCLAASSANLAPQMTAVFGRCARFARLSLCAADPLFGWQLQQWNQLSCGTDLIAVMRQERVRFIESSGCIAACRSG